MNQTIIDEQVSRLPENIGNFTRRVACLPQETFIIQYTTHGFYQRDSQSVESENDVLYIERGKSIRQVVEQILVRIDMDRRLRGSGGQDEPYVYIDSGLRDQGMTRIAAIQPTGKATALVPCRPLPPSYSHVYFLIQAKEYLLAFGRKGDEYFFRRNNACVRLPIPPPQQIRTESMALAVVWGLDEIGISAYLASDERKETKPTWKAEAKDWRDTAPTVPPNSLYVWARKQLLISRKEYDHPGSVFSVIVDALRALNEDISQRDDLAGFWDEQRSGRQIVESIPKREPIITKHIESRLRDITLQKNIDIMREVEIGNSKLDLLFSAPVAGGDTVKVCVEVKKAHAKDLAHGLSTQLPEYMRRVGTDYGIYCVLDFGHNYPHQVKPFEQSFPGDFSSNSELYRRELQTLLNIASSSSPFKRLVPIVIDVSARPSASQI